VDDGPRDLDERHDRWAPRTPGDRAAEEQRQAAERESSFLFQGPSPAEQREMKQLAAGRYPKASVNHSGNSEVRRAALARRDPGVRRKPTRDGRAYRPGARRTSRVTRAGPQSEDESEPPHRAAAATLVRTAAAGIVVYAWSRRDAIAFSRVVKRAIRTHLEARYG
jgi:hypothetical protein